MYPFDRFSERAKTVLTLAQEEAERGHHSYIGTEHMLLGLMRENDGLAAQALTNLGVKIGPVREAIESVIGRNERVIIQQIIPTSRVKTVIEVSFEEAHRMGSENVGTHHLLLGLAIEGDGIAAHVMQDLGADTKRIRVEIERLLASGATEAGLAAPDRFAEFQVGRRVLVHDPDPPHRLWEGRVAALGGHQWEVAIPDRPAGETVTVAISHLHAVPMTWSRGCPFCQFQ
jgi:ATP-dependent Clp protease ATP-binding subunit ClpA